MTLFDQVRRLLCNRTQVCTREKRDEARIDHTESFHLVHRQIGANNATQLKRQHGACTTFMANATLSIVANGDP
jgi:hypothetical protein